MIVMTRAEDVSRLSALRFLGMVGPDEVVDWATRAMAEGDGSETTAKLADLPSTSSDEIDAQLTKLAGELDVPEMTEARAGLLIAAGIARELGVGLRQPIDAAREIWRLANLAPSAEPRLRVFIGLASEWEDDLEHRDLYEEEIRAEALTLGVLTAHDCDP